MRKYLITLMLLLICSTAHAQTYEISTPGNNVGIGTTSPRSTLDVIGTLNAMNFIGSFSQIITNVSTTYTVLSTDSLIRATGTFTVTLPVSNGSGKKYDIINIGTGTITVSTSGSDTIDGIGATLISSIQYQNYTLIDSSSGHWEII